MRALSLLLVAAFAPDATARSTSPVIVDQEPVINWLEPDQGLHQIKHVFRNGGALERFTATPGSWYALIRVDALSDGHYELIIDRDRRDAEVQAFALDGDPFDTAAQQGQVHSTPILKQGIRYTSVGRGDRWRCHAPFPSGLRWRFLLIEWHASLASASDRPPSLFVDIRSNRAPQIGRGRPPHLSSP